VEIQLNRWMAQDTHPRGGDTAEERMSQDSHPGGGDTAEERMSQDIVLTLLVKAQLRETSQVLNQWWGHS
jgi:hypothetical protein